jgi:hypothetical protein
VLPVEHMAYSFLEIDCFENCISVFGHSCSKDDDLVELAHLEQKNIEAEPLGDIYLFHVTLDFDFQTEIIPLLLLERSEDKSLVKI